MEIKLLLLLLLFLLLEKISGKRVNVSGFFSFRNVVKSFYTAQVLFDVLSQFGELSEELQQKQKYAKWKAAYIHRCLKTGETPVPGPQGGEEEGAAGGVESPGAPPPAYPGGGSGVMPPYPASNASVGMPGYPPEQPPSQPSNPQPTYQVSLLHIQVHF